MPSQVAHVRQCKTLAKGSSQSIVRLLRPDKKPRWKINQLLLHNSGLQHVETAAYGAAVSPFYAAADLISSAANGSLMIALTGNDIKYFSVAALLTINLKREQSIWAITHNHHFCFQFSRFETEKVFDTVQILGGGRTEESATTIATLSGSMTEQLRGKSFTSASNFMIIKFRTDESEEKSGFLASWTTDTQGQSCGGDLNALASPQILASPGYDGR